MSFIHFSNRVIFRPAEQPAPEPPPANTAGTRKFILVRQCCISGKHHSAGEKVALNHEEFRNLKASQRLEHGATW